MKEWFESWFDTEYYHILYKNRSDEEAQHFVDALIGYLHPTTGSTLLDLACGKGRHAQRFAQHGLNVVGVDLSLQSILKAQTMEHDRLQFYVHDMRHLFRINYFDIICNLFTSFGYFEKNEDHKKVAKAIVGGLKPKGAFVLDFVNQAHGLRAIQEKPVEHIEDGDIVFDIKRSFEGGFFIKRIQVTVDGQTKSYQERVKSFTEKEILDLFLSNGLNHVKTFGTYSLTDYAPSESPLMIVVFQKA